MIDCYVSMHSVINMAIGLLSMRHPCTIAADSVHYRSCDDCLCMVLITHVHRSVSAASEGPAEIMNTVDCVTLLWLSCLQYAKDDESG